MSQFSKQYNEKMSIETMGIRLGFDGGNRQQDRMILDKLRSLKKALLYS